MALFWSDHGAIRKLKSCGATANVGQTICHNFGMCGRYRLSRRKQIIEEYFETASWNDDWSPHYNIAPTQAVPVIRQHPKEPVRQISLLRWGLIPHWSKDPRIAASTINAKSETAATKPAFRDPLKLRRCLIPADGKLHHLRAPLKWYLNPHQSAINSCSGAVESDPKRLHSRPFAGKASIEPQAGTKQCFLSLQS